MVVPLVMSTGFVPEVPVVVGAMNSEPVPETVNGRVRVPFDVVTLFNRLSVQYTTVPAPVTVTPPVYVKALLPA
jgi:hypothetical protein